MKIDKIFILLILLMIIPIWFMYMNTVWVYKPTTKKQFTADQINEICEKFKFELAPNETIYTEYWAGFAQATTWIKVYVENVKSKEDFLSRFHGNITEYGIEIFNFETRTKRL